MTAAEPKLGDSLVQSYVKRQWFVSTVYRRSSAPMAYDSCYWETIVWECDGTQSPPPLGKMLDCREGGLTHHLDVCRRLAEGRPLEDPEVDE